MFVCQAIAQYFRCCWLSSLQSLCRMTYRYAFSHFWTLIGLLGALLLRVITRNVHCKSTFVKDNMWIVLLVFFVAQMHLCPALHELMTFQVLFAILLSDQHQLKTKSLVIEHLVTKWLNISHKLILKYSLFQILAEFVPQSSNTSLEKTKLWLKNSCHRANTPLNWHQFISASCQSCQHLHRSLHGFSTLKSRVARGKITPPHRTLFGVWEIYYPPRALFPLGTFSQVSAALWEKQRALGPFWSAVRCFVSVH